MSSQRRILLVDDDRQVLRGLSDMLQADGFDTVSCDRFTDAKAYLAEQRPDLMITDVRLGAYNGLQLALYARSRHSGMPVIVLTGFEDPTLREEAERSGAVFLIKPLRREELLKTMGRLLEQVSQSADNGSKSLGASAGAAIDEGRDGPGSTAQRSTS